MIPQPALEEQLEVPGLPPVPAPDKPPITPHNPACIHTLNQLRLAAYARRLVRVPKHWWFDKPRTARFVMRLPGTWIWRLFRRGMFLVERTKPSSKGV